MQRVVIDEPYRFIPPHRSTFWMRVCRPIFGWYMRRTYGIAEYECRGLDSLRSSLKAGHAVLLAPNHPRAADPLAVGFIDKDLGVYHYSMASWHLFHQDRLSRFMIPRLGGFSIFREGTDRAALDCAIGILIEAKRPLVVFPEGVITRTNDHLITLLEGTTFIARRAARKRAEQNPPGRVVIHPVALRYVFLGDAEAAVRSVLRRIEERLLLHRQDDRPPIQRVCRIALSLLAVQETQYFGQPQDGALYDRLERLIERMLVPLEKEWLNGSQPASVVERVKNLRSAILPDLIANNVEEAERARRWRQLTDCYYAQQFSQYARDYLTADSPPEHLLETVQALWEDLTDEYPVLGPWRLILEVGQAIDVTPERVRGKQTDPLIDQLRSRLDALLKRQAAERADTRPDATLTPAPSDIGHNVARHSVS